MSFSSLWTHYIAIYAIKVFEIFSTHYHMTLVQDPMVRYAPPKYHFKLFFLLFALETTVLSFFKKNLPKTKTKRPWVKTWTLKNLHRMHGLMSMITFEQLYFDRHGNLLQNFWSPKLKPVFSSSHFFLGKGQLCVLIGTPLKSEIQYLRTWRNMCQFFNVQFATNLQKTEFKTPTVEDKESRPRLSNLIGKQNRKPKT